jgi:hypothetical protein
VVLMSFFTEFDDSPDELRTLTPDGRNLVFLTGTAGFNFKGTGPAVRRDNALHPVGPMWQRVDDVAATAAVTSSKNEHEAVDYLFAIDNCRWVLAPSVPPSRIILVCQVAVADIDAHVYRFAYQVTALGRLQ